MHCGVDIDDGDEDFLDRETKHLDSFHGRHVWEVLLMSFLVRDTILEDDCWDVEEEGISDDHCEDQA